MIDLSGKVAIITGAGSGVGRAASLLFARHGASVCCLDIDEDGAATTAQEVVTSGGAAAWSRCDISSAEQVDAAVESSVARFGRVDIMYNNAGIASAAVGRGKSFVEFGDGDIAKLVSVNFVGTIYGCRAAIARFLKQGGGGVIINTSSVAGLVGWGGVVYGATKGAVNQLTRGLAIEYAPNGIRVNSVCPAGMITNFGRLDGPRETPASELEIETYGQLHPLGKPIAPEDAAQAALFLASDAAANITGVNLPVDGGYVAR
jgi:NAD(P)-dependent dehydrogenase (short-subunit alcohol dehydrogenase family)